MKKILLSIFIFGAITTAYAGSCSARASRCSADCEAASEYGTSCTAGQDWAKCKEWLEDGTAISNYAECDIYEGGATEPEPS